MLKESYRYFVQCDLLDMPAVGQLEKDAKYALVYQLLKIFLTQRLDAYLEFQAANSTLLKSYGNIFNRTLMITRCSSILCCWPQKNSSSSFCKLKFISCLLLASV